MNTDTYASFNHSFVILKLRKYYWLAKFPAGMIIGFKSHTTHRLWQLHYVFQVPFRVGYSRLLNCKNLIII